MLLFLPSTLDRKEYFLKWKDHVHLHPVDFHFTEISNQNLVRNSDAYISTSGKIDPDNEFSWLMTRIN